MTSTPSDSTSMSARSAKTLLLCLLYAQLSERAKASTALDFQKILKKEKERLAQKKPCGSQIFTFPRNCKLDERQHRLWRAPETVFYIADFITQREESLLLERICQSGTSGWEDMGQRRFRNAGGIPSASDGMIEEPLEDYLSELRDAIVGGCAFGGSCRPNHFLINEYRPMSGISRHKDGPLYGGRVAILSLQSTCTLEFSPDKSSSRDEVTGVFLEPRSLLVFEGEAYWNWWHEICSRDHDIIDESLANIHLLPAHYQIGSKIVRKTRISLTLREVSNIQDPDRKFVTSTAEEEYMRKSRQFKNSVYDKM